jgi:hypothetical protein
MQKDGHFVAVEEPGLMLAGLRAFAASVLGARR